MVEIIPSSDRNSTLINELVAIWEKSVKATHLFLTDEDIKSIRPEVITGLNAIPVLCISSYQDKVIGFAGIAENKLEMLFISPAYLGRGFGYELLTYAQKNFALTYVDVNEQNPKALAFYERQGFSIYKRSPKDDAGRDFPILHLIKRS